MTWFSGIENALANITVEFDGEPPDAHLYANRDAFSGIKNRDKKTWVL